MQLLELAPEEPATLQMPQPAQSEPRRRAA